jgi:nucleoside-diphosphate-sugar epimerase
VDENHPDNPTDIYGVNKLAAEKYLWAYCQVYGIPFVSMRLNNIYGRRAQMRHGHYAIINYFLALAMQAKTITVYGDGSQTRDFLYIDDAVDALILAAERQEANGEVFMVGSGVETKFIDMVDLVIQTVGKGSYVNIPYPPEREKIDIKRFAASYAKLNAVSGWQPKTSLEQGIRKTLSFYETRLHEYL